MLTRNVKQFIPQEPYTLNEVWETDVFEKMKAATPSPCFKVKNHNWKLVLFKNGSGSGSGNSVSVFLMHPRCEDSHPVTFSIKSHGGNKIASFSLDWTFSPIVNNKGQEKFIPLKDIKDYLNASGKLELELCITFSPPQCPSLNNYKEMYDCVGLENLGATCYLNSMLQNLFHTPQFRRAVYKMPTNGTEDMNTSIPLALQRLFTLMQMSPLTPSTSDLLHSFGWGLADQFMQHDVQEFLRVLVDNLETKMKNTPDKNLFANIFKGTTITTLAVESEGYSSKHKEDFYDLELIVRGNKTLNDALVQFAAPESIEDYKYDDNKPSATATRNTKFGALPPILHLLLQRFEYNPGGYGMIKVSDRFEFPTTIDLKEFVDPEYKDQETRFNLFGVLIHIGVAMGGHYEALMKVNGRWLLFNDDEVKEVSEYQISETFGGQGKWATAYFLIYAREGEEESMKEVTEEELPEHLRKYFAEWKKEATWHVKETKVEILDDESVISTINSKPHENKYINIPVDGYKVSDAVRSFSDSIGCKTPGSVRLFTVDSNGYPLSRINTGVTIADQFAKSQRVFVSPNAGNGTQPLTVAFYDPTKSTAISFLFVATVNQTDSASTLIPRVKEATGVNDDLIAYYVNGLNASPVKLDAPIGRKTGLIVFQKAKITNFSPVKVDSTLTSFRSIDLLPELRGDSVEKYLHNASSPCNIKVISYDNKSEEINIEVSSKSHISVLVKCIKAAHNLPSNDGLIIFRQDPDGLPSEEPINILENANIGQLVPGKIVYYKSINGISQKTLEENLFFQPEISLDGKFTKPALLMPTRFNVQDVFDKLKRQKLIPLGREYRMLMLVGSRIVKILKPADRLKDLLSNKFRVEVTPDDQKEECKAKVCRVTFTTNTRDPRSATTGYPFFLTLIPGEKFEQTKEKINEISNINKDNDTSKIHYGYNNGVSIKYTIPKDEEVLYDKMDNNDMLYVFVPSAHPIAKQKVRKLNKGNSFMIYN